MNLAMKDIPISERPRERFLEVGVSQLSNEELLAILLKTGTKEQSAKQLANVLLHEIGSLDRLKEFNISMLMKIKGIGSIKAMELLVAVELGKRIFLFDNEKKLKRYHTAREIFESSKYLFRDLKQEHFYCFYFNTKQELIERKLLFMGTINRSIVHPREVFKQAYLNSASSIICVHNHPSNDVLPSKEDIRLTKALIQIGELNGIPIVDHIIVGNYDYYSFNEHGKMIV